MITKEREMVQKYPDLAEVKEQPFTSLQPTYEDTVPDDADSDDLWDDDQRS